MSQKVAAVILHFDIKLLFKKLEEINVFGKKAASQADTQKKNGGRRYSILLLALLFIGFASYGTYAYFTDSTSVDGDIKLSTGTISLGDAKTEGWQYVPADGNENTERQGSTNLQPGDYFEKSVTVSYTGSLDAAMTAAVNDKVGADVTAKGFSYSASIDDTEVAAGNTSASVTVKPAETVKVTLKVGVPERAEAEVYADAAGRNMAGGISLDEIADAVTITVDQVTK